MPIKKVKGWCVKPSIFENDGTPDNSWFTSCATDGRGATSPGVASPLDQEVISLSPPREYEVYPRAFQAVCLEYTCLYQRTRPYFNPVTSQTYNTLQCYNCQMDCTCEWEYANNNELDGSPDNGAWTSLDTNNANPNDDVIVEAEQEESVETSVASSEDSVNDKDIPV